MNRFPLPGDDRLESLIRESFDAIPGPDMRRLEQLESRLVRTSAQTKRRVVNTLPWWAVLLLTGSFATASWWVADRIFDAEEEQAAVTVAPVQPAAVEQGNNDNDRSSQEESPLSGQTGEQKSPVIYTRENF